MNEFYPANVVSNVHFLVLRMSTVITSTYRQQQNVLSCGLLQSKSYRDGTTFSSHVWLYVVNMLGSPRCCFVVRMGRIFRPWMATISHKRLE